MQLRMEILLENVTDWWIIRERASFLRNLLCTREAAKILQQGKGWEE